MTHLLQDLRFALHLTRKHLVIASLAMLAFLLGVGAQSGVSSTLSRLDLQISGANLERLSLLGLSGLTALALGWVAVGIYGVMTYSVAPCAQEIGLRLARGARASEVLRLVVGQGVKLALQGMGIGLSAALLLARWIKISQFGVDATDPFTFGGVAILLGVMTFLVYYRPARRAAKTASLALLN